MWVYLTETFSCWGGKFTKFRKLVKGYRDRGHSLPASLFYASRLIYRREQLEHYSRISSVRENGMLFVKTVIGGTPQLLTFRIKNGPKPVLEYSYFDEKRNDKLFLLLAGPNRDFNGHSESLFLFGNEIRYKFMNQPEITIKSQSPHRSTTHLEKKIFSICQTYD